MRIECGRDSHKTSATWRHSPANATVASTLFLRVFNLLGASQKPPRGSKLEVARFSVDSVNGGSVLAVGK